MSQNSLTFSQNSLNSEEYIGINSKNSPTFLVLDMKYRLAPDWGLHFSPFWKIFDKNLRELRHETQTGMNYHDTCLNRKN